MRIGTPALRRMVRRAENGEYAGSGARATYGGVYLKAALYVIVTLAAVFATQFGLMAFINNGDVDKALMLIGIIFGLSFIPLLIVTLVIVFVPSTAKVLGFVYAFIQGCTLGLLTLFVDLFYPGIALAALLGTIVVFLVSVFVNGVLKVRVSSKLVRGLIIALVSMAVVQLVMFIISLFTPINYTAYLWIQLAASALCIIWATVILFYDLQNIDYIVGTGADKKYEWNVAFSLVTTLIYLYVQILELMLRIAQLFSKSNR